MANKNKPKQSGTEWVGAGKGSTILELRNACGSVNATMGALRALRNLYAFPEDIASPLKLTGGPIKSVDADRMGSVDFSSACWEVHRDKS